MGILLCPTFSEKICKYIKYYRTGIQIQIKIRDKHSTPQHLPHTLAYCAFVFFTLNMIVYPN